MDEDPLRIRRKNNQDLGQGVNNASYLILKHNQPLKLPQSTIQAYKEKQMKSDVIFNRRNLSLKSIKVTKHDEYNEETNTIPASQFQYQIV